MQFLIEIDDDCLADVTGEDDFSEGLATQEVREILEENGLDVICIQVSESEEE
jgi:hypothetical protein